MLGGTVAFSFKGDANPKEKTALVNGTYGPLYLFEKNFKDVPILKEFFGKNHNMAMVAWPFMMWLQNIVLSQKWTLLSSL